MSYRLAPRGVIRIADELLVTRDMAEWQEYRQWLKAGGVPEQAIIIQPPLPTAEEITARMTVAIQLYLDSTAKTRGYDGILSACSYATDINPPFALEAQACVEFRSAVWRRAYGILAEVNAGTRPIPTVSELIGLLPSIQWPN